ncbi:MAG: VanW family protein, partial [Myxococcota bacterium]
MTEQWLAGTVELEFDETVVRATRAELGARWDARGQLVVTRGALPPMIGFEAAALADFLDRHRPSVERPPEPGSIDAEAMTFVPHVEGLRLDHDPAMRAIQEGLRANRTTIDVPLTRYPPDEGVVPQDLSFDAVVGEYTTRFRTRGRYRNRSRNVATAAARLHGAIIQPGETLSFNDRVGERSRAMGYRMAPVILRGELVQGMGGGVCQVSSTLYGAAFFCGLDLVTHTAHSRPSTYIMAGLDATVVWPDVDLVIQNPFDFPLYVHAQIERNRLTVQLLGQRKPREVEIARRTLRRRPFEDRLEDDPDLPSGTEEITQEGMDGRTIL